MEATDSPMAQYLLYGAAITGLLLAARLFPRKKQPRGRSMSFNSQAMVHNAFPPEAGVAPPIINILFFFENCPSTDKLKGAIDALNYYDRFRCAPRKVPGKGNVWEFCEVPDFNMSSLISTVEVSSEAELMAKADKIIADTASLSGASMDRPLHQMIRIVNSNGIDGLIIRVHHVIGDGISLVETMSRLFKLENGSPYVVDIPVGGGAKGSTNFSLGLSMAFKLAKSFLHVLGLAVSPYDTTTPFSVGNKADRKMPKDLKTVVFPTLKTDFVKAIKNKAAVTINDVILSATAGAIRRYNAVKSASLKNNSNNVQCRVLLPVAFPRSRKDANSPSMALRNYWAFISTLLPMGEMSATERLSAAHAITNELKSSPTAGVQQWVQSKMLPLLPLFLQRKTAHDIFSRHTLVLSNVPGPGTPLTFCGHKLISLQIVFPNLIPQSMIISYSGSIFYNMSISEEEIPDGATLLPKFYLEEITEMATKLGIDTSPASMLAKTSSGGLIKVID